MLPGFAGGVRGQAARSVRGTHRARSYAGPAGLREGRGPGRGWRAAGVGPLAARARRRGSARRRAGRASLCSLSQPPMGEVEPGPAGPLEPPEPPEAPASRRLGGIRVLKVRQAGRRAGEGARTGRGRPCPAQWPKQPATPASRWSVRFALWLPRDPAGGAAAPAEASAPGPRRGRGRLRPRRCPSLAARHPPRRPMPWGRRPPGRRRPPGSFETRGPASASLGRAGGPGAGGSWPESGAGSTQGFLPGHLKTSPQREDGGGDWPGAAVCSELRLLERADSALGASPPKLRPAPRSEAPAWKHDLPGLERESPEELHLGESLGVLQREEGLDKKGHSCWRERG